MIVVPSYHPAFLLRSSDDARGEARFEPTVIGDFRKALAFTRRVPSWIENMIHEKVGSRIKSIYPTVEEVIDFCRWAAGKLVTIDIEATGASPMDCSIICVGLCAGEPNKERTLCVPILRCGGGKYWAPQDEPIVLAWLKWLLGHPTTPKNFQNGAFDTIPLWRSGLPVACWTDDTLIAHHVADGELPHGLDFLASIMLEVPYWKAEGKGDEGFINIPDEQFRIYNLRDALSTHRILPKLLALLRDHKLESLYREERYQSEIMAQATVRGMMVDRVRRDSTEPCSHDLDKKGRCKVCGELNPKRVLPIGLGPRMELYRGEAETNLRSLAGDSEFKPGSLPQLRRLFFERLKFPVVAKTDKGAPCLNKEVMVLLALHADTAEKKAALSNLITWRRADKMLGTYVHGLEIGPDGRLHVIWKVFGAVTGRYSSSPNAQNWNFQVKRIFVAADGCIYVGVDLSQAELRGIGYLANDEILLEMYRRGINVHTVNAALLFQVRNPGIDTNDETEKYLIETLGKEAIQSYPVAPAARWKEIRKLAKNFVFGDNYGAIAETLYTTLFSKLDPDTGEQMFPDLEPDTIVALKEGWEKMHPAIVRWWSKITDETMRRRHYRSPYSGRIRWYRGGFKRNDMLNTPIQEIVAAHMRRIISIYERARREAPNSAIVSQIHDATTFEAREDEADTCARIMTEELSKPFALPGYPEAYLPPDEPTKGRYFNEV